MNERDIFLAALEITDPNERRHWLDKTCGDNVTLRAAVDALFTSHEQAGSFLGTPIVQPPTQTTSLEQPPSHSEASIDDQPTLQFAGYRTEENEVSADNDIPRGYLSPSTKPDSLGRLGHYEVLAVLGKGAFGTVMKAFDEKLHRMVAIKVMSLELAATSPARKRFLREARASAAIRHENVVASFAVEEQPIPYLVMEYIPGHTLADALVGEGPLELNESLRLGQQIAAGLAAAHSQGLIHRDIKPANILLEEGPEWKVKITDFGLARTADDASVTQSGTIAGTPMYMSPEQAHSGDIDHRSDLFSLGSVLYQMVSGRPPFRASSTLAVLKRVADDMPRPIQEIIPEVPDWLVAIITKLHAKNPDARFQSAQEVADLLARCQSELQRTGTVTSVADIIGNQDSSRSNDLEPAKPKRRYTTGLVLIFVMFMMLFPILFGKQISRTTDRWLWGKTPTLPATNRLAGIRLDGVDDFVQVQVNWDLPQFTIEAFVTSDDEDSRGTLVELSNYGSGTKDERIGLFDGVGEKGEILSFAIVEGRQGSLNGYGPRTPGVREHRAIVCDGEQLDYYINGVWQGERTIQPQDRLMWRMRWLTIGCKLGRTEFFKGDLDQLRVSKVARYQNNFSAVTSVSADDATLALYNFDEGQGEVAKDASGNGNDAKIFGATWLNPIK